MGSQLQVGTPVQPEAGRRPGVILASIAAGIAFAMDVVYLIVIRNQGDGMGIRVLVVASLIAAAGACAAGAARSASPDRRLVLMSGAAGGLISLGILGMFSIGLPLLIAGVLATIGAARSPNWDWHKQSASGYTVSQFSNAC